VANDILERFRRVQPTFRHPVRYIDTYVTQDGNIIYTTGRIASIIIWLFVLMLCLAFAWVALPSSEPRSLPDYVFLTVSALLAILLIIWIPHLRSPLPYFEVDTALRKINVYGGFLRWRPREVISVDDIRLFVSYVCFWSENIESSCSVVLETGQAYPLIAQLGSISPDLPAKTMGYICSKLAVRVTEREPTLGPWTWNGPAFKPRKGESLDIERMLTTAEVLYDPGSVDMPDWVE